MGGGGTYWLTSLYSAPVRRRDQLGRMDGRLPERHTARAGAAASRTPDARRVGQRAPRLRRRREHIDYLDGTRNVPMAMLYAGADELVWANHAVALMRRYADLGYEHVMWFHPGAEHLTLALLDNWIKEADWSANRTRVTHPSHVTYRTNPYLWFTKIGLRQDAAYWVRDIRPATPSRERLGDVTVDLISHRCAPKAVYGIDVTNDAGSDPVPWISQRGTPRKLSAIKQGDVISGAIRNAKSLTIDVEGACMDGRRITFDVAVDGPTVVRFSDGRPEEILRP